MKKLIVAMISLILCVSKKTEAQSFQTVNFECWMDSNISEITKFQFYNTSEITLVKNKKPVEIKATKTGKAKIIDKKIKIKPLTKCIVEKVEIKRDTTFGKLKLGDSGNRIQEIFVSTQKTFWVKFDKKGEVPLVPFTFGSRPESNTILFIPLNFDNIFIYNKDIYQTNDNATLSLKKKDFEYLKIASGKSVNN